MSRGIPYGSKKFVKTTNYFHAKDSCSGSVALAVGCERDDWCCSLADISIRMAGEDCPRNDLLLRFRRY